jgi:hypothetical protein
LGENIIEDETSGPMNQPFGSRVPILGPEEGYPSPNQEQKERSSKRILRED